MTDKQATKKIEQRIKELKRENNPCTPRQLRMAQTALEAITNEKFGQCCQCSQSISPMRLEKSPWNPTCSSRCQGQWEKLDTLNVHEASEPMPTMVYASLQSAHA